MTFFYSILTYAKEAYGHTFVAESKKDNQQNA